MNHYYSSRLAFNGSSGPDDRDTSPVLLPWYWLFLIIGVPVLLFIVLLVVCLVSRFRCFRRTDLVRLEVPGDLAPSAHRSRLYAVISGGTTFPDKLAENITPSPSHHRRAAASSPPQPPDSFSVSVPRGPVVAMRRGTSPAPLSTEFASVLHSSSTAVTDGNGDRSKNREYHRKHPRGKPTVRSRSRRRRASSPVLGTPPSTFSSSNANELRARVGGRTPTLYQQNYPVTVASSPTPLRPAGLLPARASSMPRSPQRVCSHDIESLAQSRLATASPTFRYPPGRGSAAGTRSHSAVGLLQPWHPLPSIDRSTSVQPPSSYQMRSQAHFSSPLAAPQLSRGRTSGFDGIRHVSIPVPSSVGRTRSLRSASPPSTALQRDSHYSTSINGASVSGIGLVGKHQVPSLSTSLRKMSELTFPTESGSRQPRLTSCSGLSGTHNLPSRGAPSPFTAADMQRASAAKGSLPLETIVKVMAAVDEAKAFWRRTHPSSDGPKPGDVRAVPIIPVIKHHFPPIFLFM